MAAADVLNRSVHHTHDVLSASLQDASLMASPVDQPRKAFEGIDTFLAMASKHLNAVDAVLLPVAGKRLEDGHAAVHDYLASARDLEIALAHVKARAYGSTYETGHPWESVWADVGDTLISHRRHEADLAVHLSEEMEAEELDALTEKLHAAEADAPSRPHPYLPHTGLLGLVVRKVMHAVDAFWDTAEGRMTPERSRPPQKRPGLLAQYILADPRFDEERAGQDGGGSEAHPGAELHR